MKHIYQICILLVTLLCANSASAVYVEKMPVNQIQPNGDTVHFFVTGDEFYHRYHDAENYTIVQNRAGYWVYATASKDGQIVPTDHLVNSVNPAQVGLVPGISITQQEYQKLRHQWDIPEQYQSSLPKTSGRNHGDFCNLVIFIRFADDTVYTRPLSDIDRMFSDSSRTNSTSVYNYFKRASYNKIFIRTYYAPTPDGNQILSYKSEHPRAYYMPYSENNPIGYTSNDRSQREFDLLVSAVNWINDSSPIPTSYNLDCDNDGNIDNVNFVVKGSYTGWSDLLWPHKWNLYGHDVFINGKRVNTFNFALEGAGDDYFGTSTFCHEMFHSLGAPDLYHYNSNDGTGTPVGIWDLMATNSKPPQHSLAWLKYKYGNWLDSIPLITTPGVYTLHSNADSVPGTMALRFPSADPDQFYVVEYRDNTETFETTLPGKGLVIYRVDTRFDGNAGYDGATHFNEVWVFRAGAASDNENGSLSESYFTPARNRTEFSPSTNPFPYLSEGTRDMTFAITNISTPGNTCRFRYTNRTTPADLKVQRITSSSATLSWKGNGNAYRLSYRPAGSGEPYRQMLVAIPHKTILGLEPNTIYEWTVRSLYDFVDSNNYADSSQMTSAQTFHTELCNNPHTDTIGWYTIEQSPCIPFQYNQKYNCFQSIYTADELHGEKNISTLSLHYSTNYALNKDNCTIYLGNTTLTSFNDSIRSVPFEQLTQVYTGQLHFAQGWNEIVLDNTFHYNGTDNLVLVIDDNSTEPSRLNNKFYTHSTDKRMTSVYYSDSANPDPAQDSIVGSNSCYFYRLNAKFTGCPNNSSYVYACIISDNNDLGTVTGEGLYDQNETITIQAFPRRDCIFVRWNDDNTQNPRQLQLTSDTLLVAYFHSHLAIDNDQPGGFVVMTKQQSITVSGAEQEAMAVYDVMGRLVARADAHHANPVTFQLPAPGVYLLRVGDNKPVKLLVSGR